MSANLVPSVQSGLTTVAGAIVTERRSSNGRSLGLRAHLTGESKSASELRKEGKEAGLTGKELTQYVNASLTGDNVAAAWIRHDSCISILRNKVPNAIPVHFDANKNCTRYRSEIIVPKLGKAGKSATAKAVEIAQAAEKAIEAAAAKLVTAGKFATIEEAKAFLA